jgi:branched-chain amino acid transport system permease protein
VSQTGRLALGAAAVLVLATLPWVVSDFLLSLALTTLMYVGLAVSWAMFSGATNYLSLATAAFFGLGA